MTKTLSAACLAAATALCLSLPSAATAQSEESYIGSIWLFGGSYCPRGTMEANGAVLPIAEHTALFAVLGISYGGDGRTTFALPDLRRSVNTGSDGNPVAMRYCITSRGVFPSR